MGAAARRVEALAAAHQNFYDDSWESDYFAFALGEIRTLIQLLDAAEQGLPPDPRPPTARHYRRRHGLSLVEGE